ncbi:putative lipid-binding protein At4g00165, partial [Neltuma alba]
MKDSPNEHPNPFSTSPFPNKSINRAIESYNLACPPNTSCSSSSSSSASKAAEKCPMDTLKFGVCGSWLGLVTEVIGSKPSEKCCTVVKGLADLEAALCLCTAIKANVLGNNLK